MHAHASIDPTQLLRAASMRVTHQRVAVLAALHERHHATADEVQRHAGDLGTQIPVQTVHGVLGDLVAGGIVRRVHLAGSSASHYEVASDDNHHHIRCVVCGRVEDVPELTPHGSSPLPSSDHGMRVLETSITFSAICHRCERTFDE